MGRHRRADGAPPSLGHPLLPRAGDRHRCPTPGQGGLDRRGFLLGARRARGQFRSRRPAAGASPRRTRDEGTTRASAPGAGDAARTEAPAVLTHPWGAVTSRHAAARWLTAGPSAPLAPGARRGSQGRRRRGRTRVAGRPFYEPGGGLRASHDRFGQPPCGWPHMQPFRLCRARGRRGRGHLHGCVRRSSEFEISLPVGVVS